MKKNDLLLFGSLALYSYLFYEQSAGINFLLFSPLLVLFLLIKDKMLLINKAWWFTAIASIATAITVFMYGNVLSVIANIISLSLMASLSMNKDSSILLALLYSLYSYLSSIAFIVINIANKKMEETKQKNPVTAKILLILIPVIITLVFFFLYREANPIFKNFTKNINLDFITWSWIRFTLFGFILLYGFFNHRKIQYLFNKDLKAFDELSKENESEEINSLGKNLSKENENLSGIILFSLLNILLLFVNGLDINFLFISGTLPEGTTYSDFVHQGIGSLITSIIIAISIILFYFRGGLNFYKKNTAIKVLAYLWIIQNAALILTTASKNQLYIDEYSLTYKRIGVYIYLLLSLIGLITTFIKILKIKSNWFLFRKNGWAFYVVLIISCFFNWRLLVTNYNIQKRAKLDKPYLLHLSESSLPDLLNLENENKNDIDDLYRHQLHTKTYQFLQSYKSADWQSWNIENSRINNEINKLNQEDKIKEMNLKGIFLENLIPINHITKLKSLNISNTQFKNIKELSHYNELEYLNISSTRVDSLDNFPTLKNLKELDISSNIVENYSFLNNAPALEKLSITHNLNPITKYPELINLHYLDLSSSKANHYDFKNFSNLKTLKLNNIDKNKIYDLPHFEKLISLELNSNYIQEQDKKIFEMIFKQSNLKNLNLSSNGIKSLSNLDIPENNIKKLNLSRNELIDLNGIEKFRILNSITLYNCKLSNLSCLSALTDLISLDAGYNTITNLSVTPDLPNLKIVKLSYNNISDISPLSLHVMNVEELDLSHNPLSEIKSLEKLPKIKKLDLTDCPIQNSSIDFSKLTDLESLQINNLSDAHIQSITKLKKLTYLKCQNLSAKEVEDLKKSLPKLIIEEWYRDLSPVADTTAIGY